MRDRTIDFRRSQRAVALVLAALACLGCQAAPIVESAAIPAAPAEQQPAAGEAPAQPDELQPQPIPEADVPARADVVAAALQRIEALLEPSAELQRIEAELDRREAGIPALRSQVDALDPTHISQRRLGDMRVPWLDLDRDLASWRATVGARFDDLQQARDELRTMRDRWQRTLDTATDVELSPELAQIVQSTLNRVVQVEEAVRARRDAISAVLDQIAASREAVAEALRRIDAIAGELRSRLLSRDAPPMWQSFGTFEPVSFARAILAAGRNWSQGIADFLRLHPGYLLSIVGWFGVFLFGALHLRRWSRTSAPGARVSEQARRVVERPLSIALACALAVTVVTLPYPTGSTADVIPLLALMPVMRLGSVVFDDRTRRGLFAIVVLVVLVAFIALAPSGAAGARLLLLIVTVLALVGTVREARVRAAVPPPQRAWDRIARWLAAGAALTLFAALLANVLGWVQLSTMVVDATIASLFGALAWAAVVAASAALLPAVIDEGPGRALRSLRRNNEAATRVGLTVITMIAVLMWSFGTLDRFNLREPVGRALTRLFESGFSIGDLTIVTGGLLGAATILAATWLAARLAGFFLAEEVEPRLHLRRGSGQSLRTLTNYAVWGVGIALAASAAGLSGTQLAVVIGALGVGIGFGLQTIVNNFVSGLILIFERPIKVGDTLQTPDYWGRVQHIGIRASVIRSFDGAEIIVPNGDLIAKEVTNWTGTDEIRRAEVLVGVAYGSDPEAVLGILRRVAAEHPKVLRHPEPRALMIRFGDSSLDFRLLCWTGMDEWLDVVSDLHVAINRELAAAGIVIPFPQRDLHIRSTGAGAEGEPEM